MFGKKDRLSQQEIDRVTERIRDKYDHLITVYMAPVYLKYEFDERYSQALRHRVGMELFLKGEMEMIEDLLRREEEARDQEELARVRAGVPKSPRKSIAEKVLDEMEQRIADYPGRNIHPDASLEITKLYGALQRFEKDFWGAVESFLLKIFPSERNGLLAQLDQSLWNMTYSRSKSDLRDIPIALERYVMMLDSNDYHYDLMGESQNCIKQGAFWLHGVRDSIRKAEELGFTDDRIKLAEGELTRIIEDFRLKEIRRP